MRSSADGLAASHGATVRRTFSAALHGFSATMTQAKAEDLAKDPKVAFVQQNQRITASQDDPPWGLDRADQRDLPLDQQYEPSTAAGNVTAYVIDTGIYAEHTDFGGRATVGTDTVGDGQNGKDCHGHGSHVAGTVAGSTYGVAKSAGVVGVRVLDCSGSGSTESVVAGIEWVTANARKPAVANMSLGGGADAALDAAVEASVAAGISYAVAAGNDSSDACSASPARTPVRSPPRRPTASTTRRRSRTPATVSTCSPRACEIRSVGIDGPDARRRVQRYVDGVAARRGCRRACTSRTTRTPPQPRSPQRSPVTRRRARCRTRARARRTCCSTSAPPTPRPQAGNRVLPLARARARPSSNGRALARVKISWRVP